MAIILAAFLVRFVFAYGISAGDDFALSGGASALGNMDAIVAVLNGTFSFTDPSLNYPVGSPDLSPPLYTALMAVLAGIATLAGVSAGTAAAGALAWSAPVFAALTCYPVYLVARRMFGDDEKIGLLAALLYAFFALLVMNTVFSNGTAYAFVGFLFAWMIHFMLRALDRSDDMPDGGLRALVADRRLLRDVLAAGLIFAAVALSWSEFRVVLTCLVALMALQALVDRVRHRDVTTTLGIYSVVILTGVLIAAPYYLAAGLWTEVLSGPLTMAVLAVGLTALFAFTAQRSWVLMVPVILAIAGAVLLVLSLAANDVFTALVHGNSIYEGSLMNALMAQTHTSISRMASYFGWLTLWLPVMVFLWMLYRYPGHLDSRKYAFTMLLIISLFSVGWFSASYAAVAGIGFAAASSAALILAARRVDIIGYFKDMRTGDLGARLKKIIKPMPLAFTIIVVALVAVPNAVYAVDAAVSDNTDADGGYFGGLGYTVQTSDHDAMNELWSGYGGIAKSGALVTWLGYSSAASNMGGFDSVTDGRGGGASAMANTLLAEGGPAAAAAMAVRLILASGPAEAKAAILAAGLDYDLIADYIDNPRTAVDAVNSDIVRYPGHKSGITGENALYTVLSEYLTSTLSGPELFDFYEAVCDATGDRIAYVAVNGGMIPLYYGDGSYFTSIAYFADSLTDVYGADTRYFSYNQYTGSATYTDAMYDTFLWKSVIGPSASYYGFNSSVSYLNALALSDGTVKAVPGYGLGGYEVAYWTVSYNPDDDATLASDGWEDMDGYEAIALQNDRGGVINYLAGVTLMEYVGTSTGSTVFQGRVVYPAAGGNAPAEGIEIAVYTRVGYDSSGVVNYIPTSVERTSADGTYQILVPDGADYYVTVSSGAVSSTNGAVMSTFGDVSGIPAVIVLERTAVDGTVTLGGTGVYTSDLRIEIEGLTSGLIAETVTSGGGFAFDNLIPDSYTLTAYKTDGTPVLSKTVNVTAGTTGGLRVEAASGKITVTVTDGYGGSPDSGSIIATDTATGLSFTAGIADGKAVIQVLPGDYTLSAADGRVMAASSSTISVSSGGSKSSSVTVFEAKQITVSGAPAGASVTLATLGYTAVSDTGTFRVPSGGAGSSAVYTAYAVVDGKVYHGRSSGSSVSMTSSTAYTVSGKVSDADGAKAPGATVMYIAADGSQYLFTADADGVYTAIVPAGEYSVYAYDGDSSAYLGTRTVSADASADIGMTGSRTITATLRYYTQITSSGTKPIVSADVVFDITSGGQTHTLACVTGSDGKVKLQVPKGRAVTAVLAPFDTSVFHCAGKTKEFSSGNSSDSVTWSLQAKPSADADMHVKQVTVNSAYVADLTLYTDSDVTYRISGSGTIPVGRYLVSVSGGTGYYFDGSVYIYPGASGSLAIDAVQVTSVRVESAAGDKVSVYAEPDASGDAGAYFTDSDDSRLYYVERGHTYHFTAEGIVSGTDRIAYATVTNPTSTVNLDLRDKAEAVTVSGYAGVNADGTVTVVYGQVSMPFPVKTGVFELTLPKGQAMTLKVELSQTDEEHNGTVYTYTASRTLSAAEVIDKAVVNMASVTSAAVSDPVLEGSNASFSGGQGRFTLKIGNSSAAANTYIITGGSAWILDRTYTLTVAGNSSGSIQISGFYDAANVGAGDPGLSVDVSDVSGNAVGTYVLDGSGFQSEGGSSEVSGAVGKHRDAMSTYEYLYAIVISNHDPQLRQATVSVSGPGSGWSVVICDSDQNVILASGGSIAVRGLTDTVIYVKLMPVGSGSKEIPGITATVSVPGSVSKVLNLTPDRVIIGTSDMSAAGSDVYNNENPIPTLFWVLMGLAVLGLIFIAWSGSKRGVFTRRK